MNKRIKFLFVCCFFVICHLLPALDFGLLVNQNAGYGNTENGADTGATSGANFDYSIAVVPRLSGLIGDNGDFIITAGFETDYDKEWGYVPELLKTELSFHPGSWALEIGRIYHGDPLGFIAVGLFDGVKVAYNSGIGTFSMGALYTGFLYKKRASIEMTEEEINAYNAPINYGDLAGTYFAPRRFLGALGWEHLGGAVQARAGVFGQFDLSAEKPLNSQYVAVKFTVPVKAFSFDLGGCLELIQNDGEFGKAFAAEAGIAFTPPTTLKNRLSLLARYASGGGDGKTAFLPLTTVIQGDILEAKLSALSTISLDYAARLHPTFSANLMSTYFIRGDLETYGGYPLGENSEGYLLGNEFFARLIWNPASDLQVNLGGGVFMPSLGDAAPKAEKLWRVEISVVFSLF